MPSGPNPIQLPLWAECGCSTYRTWMLGIRVERLASLRQRETRQAIVRERIGSIRVLHVNESVVGEIRVEGDSDQARRPAPLALDLEYRETPQVASDLRRGSKTRIRPPRSKIYRLRSSDGVVSSPSGCESPETTRSVRINWPRQSAGKAIASANSKVRYIAGRPKRFGAARE